MKKFLFTLVALMSVGSALAINTIVIPDQELTTEQLGTTLRVDCPAQFDNYVSSWRISFVSLPEGLTINRVAWGAASSTKITIYTEDGDEDQYRPELLGSYPTWLVACMAQGYDEDGNYMGTPHWIGNLNDYIRITFAIDANFQGGTIEYWVEPSAGGGPGYPAEECCPKNSHHDMTCTFTVPGAPQPQPLPGVIDFGEVTEDGLLPVCYNGEETVTLTATLNGEAVEIVDGNIQLVEGNNVVVVTASADGYEAITGTFEGTWTAPVVPQDLTGTVYFTGPTEEGIITFVYSGDEAVTMKVDGEVYNGEPIQLVPGDNEFDVTVEADGYNTLEMSFEIEWTITPPVPEVTATPNIVVTEGDEFYTITVEGNGELHMYVNNTEVEFPYIINRDVVDVTYTITATAQEDGKLISETATRVVTVPAIEDVPEDPHMTGYWLVLIDINNNPVWVPLNRGWNGDYTNTVDLNFEEYGTFNPLFEERPNVPFYFVVNGVPYGAEENMTELHIGQAMENPLYAETPNYYYVPVGFNYTLGIAIEAENEFYVYSDQAYPSGIDELVNGKQIAGVRYFNMAGQEMQEANGVTIVVTTYTDGTTSTAKVMK